MNMKEIVNSFRDRAISILRLQKINKLVEHLQFAKRELKDTQAKLSVNETKISEINSGAFVPSLADVEAFENAEEAKASVLKRLNDANETLNRYVTNYQEEITKLENQINEVESGKKPFDREIITKLSNELIREHSQDFSESEEVADEFPTEVQ